MQAATNRENTRRARSESWAGGVVAVVLAFGMVSGPAICVASGISAGPAWAVGTVGSIEGRVVDASSGDPLAAVRVDIEPSRSSSYRANVLTDESGRYHFQGVPEGSYHVYIFNPPEGYVGWIYGGLHCGFPGFFEGCPVDQGAPVSVTPAGSATGIDFALPEGGQISGVVKATGTGAPLSTAVSLYWPGDPFFGPHQVASVRTDVDGRYVFFGLPTEELFVTTEAIGYLNEVYDNVPCHQFCQPTLVGTPIRVQTGTTIDGVDFTLETEGVIAGQVTTASGSGVFSATILARQVSDGLEHFARADSDGAYSIRRLAPGEFQVQVFAPPASGSVDEIFDSMLCPAADGTCDLNRGTPVTVAAGSPTTVDFDLENGGIILGTVTDATSGVPINAFVDIFSSNGEQTSRSGFFDDQGNFKVFGLAAGNYYLVAYDNELYRPQLYGGLPCGDGPNPDCDVTTGTPVAVELGEDTIDVDFSLNKATFTDCVPSSTRLCLNEGRFAVDIHWNTASGASGEGQAVDLAFADDSGYFWFFSPRNVEVVVKVLDACQTPRNNFWVFAAGLTNVQTEMTVTDTLSGEVRAYANPQVTPFQPLLDTQAFDTCSASSSSGSGQPASSESAPLSSLTPDPALAWQSAAQHGAALLESANEAAAQSGGCGSSATSLCLNGRFEVEVDWQPPAGEVRKAGAAALTADTGVFFFLGEDNVELVVKVLSTCGNPPQADGRFWVFAGGLTNFEVTLRVTDTPAGVTKTYVNPQQMPFRPIQDTNAFATCLLP